MAGEPGMGLPLIGPRASSLRAPPPPPFFVQPHSAALIALATAISSRPSSSRVRSVRDQRRLVRDPMRSASALTVRRRPRLSRPAGRTEDKGDPPASAMRSSQNWRALRRGEAAGFQPAAQRCPAPSGVGAQRRGLSGLAH